MPKYRVTDKYSGKSFILTGDSPPTEEELSALFPAPDLATEGRSNLSRVEAAQQGRGNIGRGLLQSIGELATGKDTLNPISMGKLALQGLGTVGQSIESVLASPILAALQGKNPITAPAKALTGTPVELGDIGRQLGLPEPVNAIGGFLGSMALPGVGLGKTLAEASKLKALARRLPVGLGDIVYGANKNIGAGIGKGTSALGRFGRASAMRGVGIPEKGVEDLAREGIPKILPYDRSIARLNRIAGRVSALPGRLQSAAKKSFGDFLDAHGNDVVNLTYPATHENAGSKVLTDWVKTLKNRGQINTTTGILKGVKITKDKLGNIKNITSEKGYEGVDIIQRVLFKLKPKMKLRELDEARGILEKVAGKDVGSDAVDMAQKLRDRLGQAMRNSKYAANELDRYREIMDLSRETPTRASIDIFSPTRGGIPTETGEAFYKYETNALKALQEMRDVTQKHFPNLGRTGWLDAYRKASMQRLLSEPKSLKTLSAGYAVQAGVNPKKSIALAGPSIFSPRVQATVWRAIEKTNARLKRTLKTSRAQALEQFLGLGTAGLEAEGIRNMLEGSSPQ